MAGFFEELTQEEIEQQLQTSLYGPMIVTRAVFRVMESMSLQSLQPLV
jgi:NAD(P)-dependent dehydrogenase (short-subunit alcohol dehydrogenase family)